MPAVLSLLDKLESIRGLPLDVVFLVIWFIVVTLNKILYYSILESKLTTLKIIRIKKMNKMLPKSVAEIKCEFKCELVNKKVMNIFH